MLATNILGAANAAQSASESVSAGGTENFLRALEVMGLGMLGIFVIIGIIVLIIKLLQKLFPAKED